MFYWLTRCRSEATRGALQGTLRIWGDVCYEDEPALRVLGREVQMLTSLRVDLGGVREFGQELCGWQSELRRAFRALGTRLTFTRVPAALARMHPEARLA